MTAQADGYAVHSVETGFDNLPSRSARHPLSKEGFGLVPYPPTRQTPVGTGILAGPHTRCLRQTGVGTAIGRPRTRTARPYSAYDKHHANRAGHWTYRIRPAVGSRGCAPCRVWRAALARNKGQGQRPCRSLHTFSRWRKYGRGLGRQRPCRYIWRHKDFFRREKAALGES